MSGSAKAALVAEGLRKTYGSETALDGFDLVVPEGTVCALLGPNGAGKTTAVRILSTLLKPDGGRALVAGLDVTREAAEVRRNIGVTGQYPAVEEILTGRENLEMWGRLYHVGRREAQRRTEELLEQFDLTEAADKRLKHYSGGMRRRLDLAAGFFTVPKVLFLDEPTTGLDPRNRNEVWKMVRSMVEQGTTVLLTTQYLEEADRLADQISVIDAGRGVVEGTPETLKSLVGGDRIVVTLAATEDLSAAAAQVARFTGTEPEVDAEARRIDAPVRDRVGDLVEIVQLLRGQGHGVVDVSLRRPTLDDVFLHATNRAGRRKEPVG
ncbi:daunorubicin resistance protein DrrA family ABC transporter ATP-binding protein [Streptomyces viridochromogenes]|uniref:ABC-type xenobiotic transporter n=1 Tax=Streptomyces viridochromogenes Tue57 TaxID=1160705 RepID=Q9F5K4_STRVR|nr:daunorubicin resistance protein DrrA family ABC transporter ATP-binding protein [Streptomyces viridochromogenes]AAG32068.1 putative ATP binding protein [Streptomyces viridochromogenes Tue57]ELS56125.1 putative ATP binding protein [Streptomyces viridochromogenes Tue57]